jgi:DinB superfamily
MSNNPYGKYVEGRDPIASLEETADWIESTVRNWTPAMFERSYAPGKWTARQLLTHLVQTEGVFGSRIRFALTTPGYTIVPFNQDDWITIENTLDGDAALAAYSALRRMDIAFFKSLTPQQRAHKIRHPEYGEIDVEWIIVALAGHDRHHLPQFETIAGGATV